MRTTIELPDEIFHRAQEEAAQRGVDVNQFIAATVTKAVGATIPEGPTPSRSQARSLLPTIKGRGSGMIPNVTPELQARVEEEDDLASYRRSTGR